MAKWNHIAYWDFFELFAQFTWVVKFLNIKTEKSSSPFEIQESCITLRIINLPNKQLKP